MKIDGPNKTTGPKGPGKTGGKAPAGASGFSDLIGGTDEVSSQAAVGGAAPLGSLDALLALQGAANNPEEAAKRAKKRGLMLLDALDQIKIDLLMGGVPQGRLNQLAQMVNSQRDEVMDPKLGAVLDEIDLRVQVELAKFSRK